MRIFLNPIFFIICLPLIIINQFLLHLPAAVARDTLRPGDEVNSLDPNTILVSAGGKFALGFFTIQSTNLTYLGIRYRSLGLDANEWIANRVIFKLGVKSWDQFGRVGLDANVWVANRDIPIISSGVLMIDGSGTLKIISCTNNITLFNGSGNDTRAVLDDLGNFKLYGIANGSQILLWQSFDHPTDTLLPGMKLGYNLNTGQNWTLTSWFSSDQIPASGYFTMKYEPFMRSPQLVIYRHGEVYWTSGSGMLDDHFGFPFYSVFGATVVYDASGMYITNPTVESRVETLFQLSSMGQIKIGGDPVTEDDLCHPRDKISVRSGCAVSASSSPGCRDQDDKFELTNAYKLSGLIQDDDSSNIGLSDCMERCWYNCKCKGFSSSNINGTGCKTWDGYALINGSFDNSRMDTGVLISIKGSGRTWIEKIWKWILVSLAILVTCAYIEYRSAWLRLFYAWIRRRVLEVKEKRRRDDYINQLKGSDSFNFGDVLEKGIKNAPDIKIFSLGAILAATDSFSIENKLGQGGYGPV